MLQMKSYIVVTGIVLAASSAQAQTLEVSYQQKHATVTVPELPHTNVSAKGHDGIAHDFSCVPITVVLEAVQTPSGENLRGAGMSLVVIASAKDSYHAAFALAELDASVGHKQAFVCDKQDGRAMSTNDGPLRLVVPSDKRPARWVRMLTSLDVKAPAQD
jgi:hypothetical protein